MTTKPNKTKPKISKISIGKTKIKTQTMGIMAVLALFVLILVSSVLPGIRTGADVAGFTVKMTDDLSRLTTGAIADTATQYGGIGSDYQPVIGDWNGDGKDTLGVYQISTSTFFLSNSVLGGVADLTFGYGASGDRAVAGDWNGDGTDTVGIYRGDNEFHLKNSNSNGIADIQFAYGIAGDVPVIGDWNGDNIDTIGLFRPAEAVFYLRNSLSGGIADFSYNYGWVGADVIPLAGDFDGDGVDTGSIYSTANSNFYIRNTNEPGIADITQSYGALGGGDVPLTGDWTGSGKDSIAVYRKAEGTFYLLNSLTPAPTPTYTATPTATVSPLRKPAQTIPTLSKYLAELFDSIMWFLGLGSITGGASVTTPVGSVYTTSISLGFTPPDTDFTDKTYSVKYGKWFIANSAKAIIAESGWSSELTASPYRSTASFTPTTDGKYVLIAVVIQQVYTCPSGSCSASGWNMIESVESKEAQEITARGLTVPNKATVSTTSTSMLDGFISWLKGWFSWITW